MINKILFIDVDHNELLGTNSQLFSSWTHHPLGLLYLSSSIHKKFPDTDIRIFHTITSKNPIEDIESLISEFSPDLIGLRSLSIAYDSFMKVSKFIRKTTPETTIIAGGPLPSSSYKNLLTDDLADIIVFGEGEETFVDFMSSYNQNDKLPLDISGTAVMDNGDVKVNESRPYIKDIDSLPTPDYELIKLKDYEGISNHAFQDTSKCAFICSSRGCPYNCFYCHQFFGKKIRHRTPENVVAEIKEHVEKRGIRDFVFVDDTFNVPMKTAKETLSLMIKTTPGIRINFPNGLRSDQIDDELIDLFEEAGTVQMSLAIETASPRMQKIVGKNLNLDKAHEAISNASKRFIVGVYFMLGFPFETYNEAMETIKFAEQFDHIAQPVLSVVRVFKGTPLFDMLEPNEKQIKFLEDQEFHPFQPKIMSKDIHFYGDIFPDDKVPLSGDEVKALRIEWLKKVVMNQDRINNSYNILKKFLTDDHIYTFYKNFYDNPGFDERALKRLLGKPA